MKNLLYVSVVSMVMAGLFGFVDMACDIASGKMIDYEAHEFLPEQSAAPGSLAVSDGTAAPQRKISGSQQILQLVKIDPVVDLALYSRSSFVYYSPLSRSLAEVNSTTLIGFFSETRRPNPFYLSGHSEHVKKNFHPDENRLSFKQSGDPYPRYTGMKPEELRCPDSRLAA